MSVEVGFLFLSAVESVSSARESVKAAECKDGAPDGRARDGEGHAHSEAAEKPFEEYLGPAIPTVAGLEKAGPHRTCDKPEYSKSGRREPEGQDTARKEKPVQAENQGPTRRMEKSARRSVSGGHRKITWEGESRVSNTPARGASFLGTKWGTDRNPPDRVWDEGALAPTRFVS